MQGVGRRRALWAVGCGLFCCLVVAVVVSLQSSTVEDRTVLEETSGWTFFNNFAAKNEEARLPELGLLRPMSPMEEYQKKLEREHQEEVAKHEKKAAKKGLPVKFQPPLPFFGHDVVFSGHLVPDADSIASSVAGAFLFDGTAGFVGEINSETHFLLEHFDVPHPQRLEDVYKGGPFVIVDHNAFSQRPKIFNASKIMGIIDHHALSQEPTVVPQPVFIDIRPWGSCSTLVATLFLEHDKWLPPPLAGLLLGGLLSDTLNLQSPTATEWDRKVRLWLAQRTFWIHPKTKKELLGSKLSPTELEAAINRLAHAQFEAKANLTGSSLEEIVMSDFKKYNLKKKDGTKMVVGWGTVETVSPFYERYQESGQLQKLVTDVMEKVQSEKSLQVFFVSFVDIERRMSVVVCSDVRGCGLLRRAFEEVKPTSIQKGKSYLFETSPRVSRKEQFIPRLRQALLGY